MTNKGEYGIPNPALGPDFFTLRAGRAAMIELRSVPFVPGR